jgi:putative photosynthetic complex assembly protein 2
MKEHAFAALFVLVLWWMSTGVVLLMVWLHRSTYRASLAAASVLALGGLAGILWSSRVESRPAAYLAFTCALAIWGWHELSFLLGIVTGPRKEPCPPDAQGFRRFGYATAAVIHHEVALAVTLAAIAALTWGEPNQVGTWTFLALWVMRLSAKFNVFLGVRNLTEDFIPKHLRYLLSYFRRARMNWLMPISVLAASAVVVRLGAQALALDASSFVVAGRTLVATLLGLAVIEHLFLSLPVPDALLWRWVLRMPGVEAPGERALPTPVEAIAPRVQP